MRNSIKTVRLGLCLLLTMSGADRAQEKDPQEVQKSCRDFVQRFYNGFGRLANRRPSRPGEIAFFNRAISPEPRRRLKEDEEGQDKDSSHGIVGLDFDPYTGSQDQDACDRYVVGNITQKGERYWANVYCVVRGRRERDPHLTPELMLKEGRWVIVNFHYYFYEKGKPTTHDDLLSLLRAYREERRKLSKPTSPDNRREEK